MVERSRIAVVGASARAAAFSLLRQGHAVVAADLFADADLRRVCDVEQVTNYPHGLAEWLSRTKCDEWLYTGALENYPDLIDRMAALRPLRGNAGSVLLAVRDPLLLQIALTSVGLNFPETHPCNGQPPGSGDWLHKTGQGASGSGVSELDPSSLPTQGYWQRRVPGMSGSAMFLASDPSCSLLGITRQLVGETWTGAREFQYAGTLSPWRLPEAGVAELVRMGEFLMQEFKLSGPFGVDFVYDNSHAWPVEVNPRTTAAAEVVERVTTTNACAGKAVLYAKRPLAISRDNSEGLLHRAGSIENPQLADIPNTDTQIASGEPILTVLADGDCLAEVEENLRERVARLESELYVTMVL